jgi:hypothetical protein
MRGKKTYNFSTNMTGNINKLINFIFIEFCAWGRDGEDGERKLFNKSREILFIPSIIEAMFDGNIYSIKSRLFRKSKNMMKSVSIERRR